MQPHYEEITIMIDDIPRLGLKPFNQSVPDEECIFIDAYEDLRGLFEDCPDIFFNKFWINLWHFELRKKEDFLHPSADKKISQALKSAVGQDVLTIKNLMKELTST